MFNKWDQQEKAKGTDEVKEENKYVMVKEMKEKVIKVVVEEEEEGENR